MSLTAVLVLTVVVLVCIAGWLIAVFRAGSEPARRPRNGGGQAGRGAEPEAGSDSQAVPAAHGVSEPTVPGR
jgi:hypothetical protein